MRDAAAPAYRHPSRIAPHGKRDIHPEQLTRTTEISEARPAMGQADAIWQSVLWFFLEGFASTVLRCTVLQRLRYT
jgi:hypothetical protein